MNRLLITMLATLVATPCWAALGDNQVAVWHLDEASGNATDAVGANTLSENGTGGIAATTGKLDGARDFEGDDADYFAIADNADLSTGDIDFSVAGWFLFETNNSTRYLVNKWNQAGNQREYALRRNNSSARLEFTVSSNGSTNTVAAWGSATNDTGVWYFVAGGHNASADEVWVSVNAATPVTASHATGVHDGTANFQIGARQGPNDHFDGLADEVGFWKRDIRSDLAALYNSGNGLAYPYGAGSSAVPAIIRSRLNRSSAIRPAAQPVVRASYLEPFAATLLGGCRMLPL